MLFKYVGGLNDEEAQLLQIMKYFCEQHTLVASEPTSFNDPFEFKIAVDLDADEATLRNRFSLDRPGASDAEYREWRRNHTSQSKWWVTQDTRKRILSRFGVFCLSALEDNHLMWSHYASSHRGFCVGIDEKQIEGIEGVVGCGFVEYRETAPSFRYYFDRPEMFDNKIFGCKSSVWAYEREYRFVFDRCGIVSFPRAALKQVILGCRAYQGLRTYANEHCEDPGLAFFQMCEDFNAYRLRKELIRRNVKMMSSFF